MKAAQKEQVAKPTRLVEGLDTRPEAKKVSQWMATIIPVNPILKRSILLALKVPRVARIRTPIPVAASSVR